MMYDFFSYNTIIISPFLILDLFDNYVFEQVGKF